MKILLVDDSRKHRDAGAADLGALGHEVTVVSDYHEAADLVRGEQKFDVALLDLLMPAEATTMGEHGMAFLGQPLPVGFALSVLAASVGIPLVCVATDMNHHDHPASALLDWFRGLHPLKVDGSTMVWMHAPLREDGCKDWVKVLNTIG